MPFSSVVVTSGCARAHAASPKADSDVENRILPIALLSLPEPSKSQSECVEPRVEVQWRTEKKRKGE